MRVRFRPDPARWWAGWENTQTSAGTNTLRQTIHVIINSTDERRHSIHVCKKVRSTIVVTLGEMPLSTDTVLHSIS